MRLYTNRLRISVFSVVTTSVFAMMATMTAVGSAQESPKDSAAASVSATSVALTPAERLGEGWWKDRHEGNVNRMNEGNIDLLVIGDSITHGWDNRKELWTKTYGPYKPINMGFSGDRTEHVLWRLEHLPLDKIQPKAATIMIGTNNIGHNQSSPKETAAGIKAIVARLKKQYPDIKVLILAVFPRDEKPDGNRRKQVAEINSYLPKLFENDKNVTILDVGPKFLAEDGTLPKEIMPDSLHPNAAGYQIWSDAMIPALEQLCKP